MTVAEADEAEEMDRVAFFKRQAEMLGLDISAAAAQTPFDENGELLCALVRARQGLWPTVQERAAMGELEYAERLLLRERCDRLMADHSVRRAQRAVLVARDAVVSQLAMTAAARPPVATHDLEVN